jgi:hypothetical protein
VPGLLGPTLCPVQYRESVYGIKATTMEVDDAMEQVDFISSRRPSVGFWMHAVLEKYAYDKMLRMGKSVQQDNNHSIKQRSRLLPFHQSSTNGPCRIIFVPFPHFQPGHRRECHVTMSSSSRPLWYRSIPSYDRRLPLVLDDRALRSTFQKALGSQLRSPSLSRLCDLNQI